MVRNGTDLWTWSSNDKTATQPAIPFRTTAYGFSSPNPVRPGTALPYLGLRRVTVLATARAIAELAQRDVPQEVQEAYGRKLEFGREYIIPKPMDVRLIEEVPAAVAKAAIDSGVATLPYPAHYPLKSEEDCK